MSAPHVAAACQLEPVEDGAEQRIQVCERLDPMGAAEAIVELPVEHPVGEEVDECVGLGVDVVAVQEHFGEVEHLLEAPHEGLDGAHEVGMRAQGVEVHAVRLEGRVVAHPAERLRRDPEPLVAAAVRVVEAPRLVEEAEVGTLHVEAHGGNPSLVRREVLEDGRQQELDGARLGRESRDARDVEVSRFRTVQEVRVQVDRRLEPSRGVQPHRDGGGGGALEVGLHAEGAGHVSVGRHEHAAERDRLQRLLGLLAQHGRGPQPNLLAHRGAVSCASGISVGADHVVQWGGKVGVGEPIRHNPEDHPSLFPRPTSLDPDNRPDPDRRLGSGPEVELVRRRRLELGGDHPADRLRRPFLDHEAALGRREAGDGSRSRGARALRYVSTS